MFNDDNSQDGDRSPLNLPSWPKPSLPAVIELKPLIHAKGSAEQDDPTIEVSYTVTMGESVYKLLHITTPIMDYYRVSLARDNLHLTISEAADDDGALVKRNYHVTYNDHEYTIFDDSGLNKSFHIFDHETKVATRFRQCFGMFTTRRDIKNYDGLTGLRRCQKNMMELVKKERAKKFFFVGLHAAYFQEREYDKMMAAKMEEVDAYDSGIFADELRAQQEQEAEDRLARKQAEFDACYRSGDRLWHWKE